jgi:oxygen-independent coproporphyrinogen-3 oxidase
MTDNLSVGVDFARRYIENHLDKRQVNKIQHAFPSPRFWNETDVPVHDVLDSRRKLKEMGSGSPINLYIGAPFCIQTSPSKCGYCLFPVEVFAGNPALERYFDYLKKEASMYKEALAGQTLGAVYIGGGTANLYKAEKYPQLMDLIQDLFPVIGPEVDITLEGIPQLFTREKLKNIKEMCNRSMSA